MTKNKTIAIGKEVRPIHYGFAALGEWCDMTGTSLEDLGSIGKNLGLTAAIQLIYCGLKHGARRNKEDFNYTHYDVGDWIDDEGMEVFNECMEIFSDSLSKLNPKEEEKKKKGEK
tara:strand:- start:14809 stop:15153 length:345 start_codon:yes stop_codon:yes gene_type:complete